MKQIFSAIGSSKNILLMAHTDPDGDAIGSMLAMYIMLTKLKKKVTMFCPDEVPEIYKFLPHSNKVITSIPAGMQYDLGIAVDCGDIKRVGHDHGIKKIVKKLVNIDHHPDNTRFGDINLIEHISSVSEIIYGLFKSKKMKIDKDVAACLYTGIMTDTGNFRYDYTTSKTLKVAADLVDCGAQLSRIAMGVYENRTMPSIKALGAAMFGLNSSETGRVVWTILDNPLMERIGAKGQDLTGIVDQIRAIKGVEVAILFREEEDGVKVNFRSKFKVNVSKIAQSLGGGGHIRAAGAVVKGDVKAVEQQVLDEVFKVIK